MKAYVRKQLAFLDDLADNWDDVDRPLEDVQYVVEETMKRAAKLGLSELVQACPAKVTLRSARAYLAACIAAGKTGSLTPPQVAKQLGVNSDKVLKWIRSGELKATNTTAKVGGRPRYRIKAADLEAFRNRRAPQPRVKPKRRSSYVEKTYL